VIRAIRSIGDAFRRTVGRARANPFDPGLDIDLCEKGFEQYQSLRNMQYDRGQFGFWNGRRW